MGAVRFLEISDVIRFQFYVDRSDRLLEMGDLGAADDRRSHFLGEVRRQQEREIYEKIICLNPD